MIAHIGFFTRNLECSKRFYERYFGAEAGPFYENEEGFSSYFLDFGGTKLEIMHGTWLTEKDYISSGHIAISVENSADVTALTERLRTDGYKVLSEPRTTGDGYFESVIEDPDGYRVEITC